MAFPSEMDDDWGYPQFRKLHMAYMNHVRHVGPSGLLSLFPFALREGTKFARQRSRLAHRHGWHALHIQPRHLPQQGWCGQFSRQVDFQSFSIMSKMAFQTCGPFQEQIQLQNPSEHVFFDFSWINVLEENQQEISWSSWEGSGKWVTSQANVRWWRSRRIMLPRFWTTEIWWSTTSSWSVATRYIHTVFTASYSRAAWFGCLQDMIKVVFPTYTHSSWLNIGKPAISSSL